MRRVATFTRSATASASAAPSDAGSAETDVDVAEHGQRRLRGDGRGLQFVDAVAVIDDDDEVALSGENRGALGRVASDERRREQYGERGLVANGPQSFHDHFGLAQLGEREPDRAGPQLVASDERRFVGLDVGSQRHAGEHERARHAIDV